MDERAFFPFEVPPTPKGLVVALTPQDSERLLRNKVPIRMFYVTLWMFCLQMR